MRMGVRFAFDVGSARIGVARCDPSGILASPQEFISASERSTSEAAELVSEAEAIEVIVGYPVGLAGTPGAAAEAARAWATRLAEQISIPVRLVDERLSTTQANRALQQGGSNSRQSRARIDSAAAAVVLQYVLDAERADGESIGEVLAPNN
jgi:putative Holliday junction resolvase